MGGRDARQTAGEPVLSVVEGTPVLQETWTGPRPVHT